MRTSGLFIEGIWMGVDDAAVDVPFYRYRHLGIAWLFGVLRCRDFVQVRQADGAVRYEVKARDGHGRWYWRRFYGGGSAGRWAPLPMAALKAVENISLEDFGL